MTRAALSFIECSDDPHHLRFGFAQGWLFLQKCAKRMGQLAPGFFSGSLLLFSDAALGAVFQLAWERALAYRQTSERLLGYLQASA